jgi:hypothetical protein
MPCSLRGVRISFIRNALAALAVLAVCVKLSMLHEGGLDPLLDGRISSSMAELAAIHNLLLMPSSPSLPASESSLRGGAKLSLSSIRASSPQNAARGEDNFLGDDGANTNHSALPKWIGDYLSWHDQQVKRINEDNWREHRYLVFRCRAQDPKCGGASDRIQPVPFGLMLANRTRRILLIEWTRPCRLEEFLLPPQNGLNWTVPSFVRFDYKSNPVISMSRHAEFAFREDMFVDIRHQSNDHGRSYYDANRDDLKTEPNFDAIYHRVWQLFFTPSPPLAAILREAHRGYRLVPNRYVGVHIRAKYTGDRGNNAEMVENAVHCATQLRPGYPVYLASDSRVASSYAIKYGRQVGAKVIAQVSDAPPLHIDRGTDFLSLQGADWMRRNASDFYDTFVDLYLLAGGACTTFNIGGYGRWASLIGSNSSCSINHHRHLCSYHSGTASNSSSKESLSNQVPEQQPTQRLSDEMLPDQPRPPAAKVNVAPNQQNVKSQDSFAARMFRKQGSVLFGGDATPKRGGLAKSIWSSHAAPRTQRTT